MRWERSPSARIGMLLLPTLIVLVCVAVTTSIAIAVQERTIRDTTGERVSDVARSLAQLEQVREELSGPDRATAATSALQPLADLVERAAGVDYVVISDSAGIRVTHPTPSKRGEPVSTDHSAVLAGEEYLGTEDGTLGPTLRAKIPVRSETGIVGTVSVGILESRISDDLADSLTQLLPWVAGALLLGTVASSLLGAAFARRLRRLDEVGAELDQQHRTATALREQTHEFHTRMHVIHGLVSHGDTTEALAYVERIAPLHSDARSTGLGTQVMLRAVVDALTAELRAMDTQLTVEVEVESAIDDETLLVIANLCRNAGEAGARHVRLTLTERDAHLRGVVEDDGPGIPPHLRNRVFARGFTSKHDATGTGRGIGLNLVRRIVIARQGSVEIGSSAAGGTRFAFEFPLQEPA